MGTVIAMVGSGSSDLITLTGHKWGLFSFRQGLVPSFSLFPGATDRVRFCLPARPTDFCLMSATSTPRRDETPSTLAMLCQVLVLRVRESVVCGVRCLLVKCRAASYRTARRRDNVFRLRYHHHHHRQKAERRKTVPASHPGVCKLERRH